MSSGSKSVWGLGSGSPESMPVKPRGGGGGGPKRKRYTQHSEYIQIQAEVETKRKALKRAERKGEGVIGASKSLALVKRRQANYRSFNA